MKRLVLTALATAASVAAPRVAAEQLVGQTQERAAPEVEATSLTGRPLLRPELPDEFVREQTVLLAEARRALEVSPSDPEAAIWVGRRTAYLGRYREAIEIYSQALAEHPDDARLYRHRGHRLISIRELDRAIADLERAMKLVADAPDEVEADGLPNERGIPTSTLQTNIWYHLGLARYLKGDFDGAASAYRGCLGLATNPDMEVAASYWLYLSLRRSGRHEAARVVLEPIGPDLEIIENQDYFLLLRSYAEGGTKPAELLGKESDAIASATRAYGIGVWTLLEGDLDEARSAFERIVDGAAWAAFGYIAAEAELAR